MNENLLRFLLAAILFVGILIIAVLSGDVHSYPAGSGSIELGPVKDFSSVSELMQNMPLEQQVSVPGEASRVLEDYISKKGYQYQQFFITDREQELKIFC